MKALPISVGIAALLACVMAWELVPASDDGGTIASPSDRAPAATGPARTGIDSLPDSDRLTGLANTLLARPLFSADRRLPTTVAPSNPVSAVEDAPRLAGIIISPGSSVAIFDDGAGRPKIVAEGASIGRFKVGTIGPDQVLLAAAEGTLVMRPKFAHSVGAVASAVPLAGAGVPGIPVAQATRPEKVR